MAAIPTKQIQKHIVQHVRIRLSQNFTITFQYLKMIFLGKFRKKGTSGLRLPSLPYAATHGGMINILNFPTSTGCKLQEEQLLS